MGTTFCNTCIPDRENEINCEDERHTTPIMPSSRVDEQLVPPNKLHIIVDLEEVKELLPS